MAKRKAINCVVPYLDRETESSFPGCPKREKGIWGWTKFPLPPFPYIALFIDHSMIEWGRWFAPAEMALCSNPPNSLPAVPQTSHAQFLATYLRDESILIFCWWQPLPPSILFIFQIFSFPFLFHAHVKEAVTPNL
jgi:hypothetical protein